MLLFTLFCLLIISNTNAKLPQLELDSLKNVVKNRTTCDGNQIGEQCGSDPNKKCVMMTFFARCRCVNGYVEDISNKNLCVCQSPRVEMNGKCECPDGQVKAPHGKCLIPSDSCPSGHTLECASGTGCMDDCPPCIKICNPIIKFL